MTREKKNMSENASKLDIWGAEESWLINYMNSRATFKVEHSQEDIKAFITSRRDGQKESILSIEGDTATIKIRGRLSSGGPDFLDYIFGWGGASYREIIAAVKELRKNPGQVKTLYLRMDTPGGDMKGLDNVWKELMALRKETDIKVIAVNHGLLASAGYYIASAAHEIHSTSETNEVGSIGVLVAGIDWTKYDEKMGIKEVVIVSKNAPDKYIDIGTDKGQGILQKRVNTFEQFFLNRISEGQKLDVKHITKNFGRGGLLVSKSPNEGEADALSVKMIDKVLNISQEAAATVSPPSPVSVNAKQESNPMSNQNLAAFLAENPGAQAEYDAKVKTHGDERYQEGLKAGREEIEGRVKKAFSVVGQSDAYPAEFTALAIKIATGEEEQAALTAVITMHDQKTEQNNSQKAQDESDEDGDTPPDNGGGPAAPGSKVETPEHLAAHIANIKKVKGMPVE
jgi:ClpP class serine protease